MSSQQTSKALLAEYEATQQGCAFHVLEGAGFVLLGGETRLDYLQRQTSNDMGLIGPARALPNVLTAPTGRILEIFSVLDWDDGYALITPPGRGAALAAYFQKRIFFNDRVAIEDRSQQWIQIELHGPEAPGVLAALGLNSSPELDEVQPLTWEGQNVHVIGIPGLSSALGYLLVAPVECGESLPAALADQEATVLSPEAAEILRLESGLPGPNELDGQYTPFEVGLAARVSDSKGCYTGQEVLARQITYDKVTRQLAVLECEALAEPGSGVLADGKTVGVVSSAALLPRAGALAMAVVRKPFHEPGTALDIRAGETIIPAKTR